MNYKFSSTKEVFDNFIYNLDDERLNELVLELHCFLKYKNVKLSPVLDYLSTVLMDQLEF